MRALHGQRLDAHDVSFAAVQASLATVGERLKELAEIQAQTDRMLRDLIAALTLNRSNGKG